MSKTDTVAAYFININALRRDQQAVGEKVQGEE